jgi:hypothetical protein
MKFLNSLSTFLPWISYGILSSIYPPLALPAGMIGFLFSYPNLRKKIILEWGSLLFFIALALNYYIFQNQWLFQHFSLLMSFFFAATAGISLLIGRPFTMQYAKLQVDPKFWNNPLFLRINLIMTGALGGLFLGTALVNVYRYYHPAVLNSWLIWSISSIAQIMFIKRFPGWYTQKHRKRVSYENYSD